MITTAQAEKTLRLLRETVYGARALKEVEEFTPSMLSITFRVLVNAVQLLDFYLTQTVQVGQEHQVQNSRYLLVFLTHSQSAFCTLADQRSQLLLRWPTLEEPHVIQLETKEETTWSIDLRRRWNHINNANSEAIDFNKEVLLGKA